MPPSPLRSITRKHARSISLPSRAHPFMPQFHELLCRASASEATPSSLSSMNCTLNDIKNLYECTDDVLRLPHIQQAISQECQEKLVDELLDGYLRLLDACATTRDLFSYTKQSIQELLSALRRKDTGEIPGYLTSRRKSKKMIQKALRELSRIRNRQTARSTEKENETMQVLSMLKEVESITISMFDSFLSYVSGTKTESGQTAWSLVSKLMKARVPNQEEGMNANEFQKVDSTLHSLISPRLSSINDSQQVEALQNQLGKIQSSIQMIEEELECLFGRLIKSRVSLLNILNH